MEHTVEDRIKFAGDWLERGKRYGDDMLSSRISCYQDARELLESALEGVNAMIALEGVRLCKI